MVKAFLADHKSVRIHYTPIYSSWLKQVEDWSSRIQRDVISHGIFLSLKDLEEKLVRHTHQPISPSAHQPISPSAHQPNKAYKPLK